MSTYGLDEVFKNDFHFLTSSSRCHNNQQTCLAFFYMKETFKYEYEKLKRNDLKSTLYYHDN